MLEYLTRESDSLVIENCETIRKENIKIPSSME